MPLPPPNTPWPPRALAPALESMQVWDAWWSGDTDELGRVYGQHQAAEVFSRAQCAGGIRGAVARAWWGRPPTVGEPATKLHVPLASDICRASADLLYSEPISASAASTETSEALDEFLGDGTHARLLEGAETGAALSGYYLRVAHDVAHFDDAWIEPVGPEMVLPEWAGGRLVAATLWWTVEVEGDDQKRGEQTVWRHLERHERGFVEHGLYRGTSDSLGRPMPLADHPSTEALALGVDELGRVETGHDGLDIVYIPNIRPQRSRKWRRSATLAPMGRSDLDGIEPVLDALDEVWSSWMRDIRLAKGRVVVPETYLDSAGPGKGAAFDPEREVYSQISAASSIGAGNGPGLTVVQFAIRVDEHERSADALKATALRTAGYSARTFGEAEDGGAITATEVVARERASYITRGRKIQVSRPELVDILTAWLAIRAHVLGKPPLDPTGLSVAFPDAVSEDMASLAQTTSLLAAAKSASIETRVRLLWPEADDVWVAAEVKRIQDEDAPSVVMPTFDGGDDPADESSDDVDEPDEDNETPDDARTG